ncbi:hypothetical protein LUZ60_014559 [Juncus effusus]|nr:hypothetical protein LUZ60_014559 [Juncus effusus]
MLSNYNQLSPEIGGLRSPSSPFPSLPPLSPLPPTLFDGRSDGGSGLFYQSMEALVERNKAAKEIPAVSRHASSGVDSKAAVSCHVSNGIDAKAVGSCHVSKGVEANAVVSCYVSNGVDPEAGKEESGVKETKAALAKPPRQRLPPIGSSGPRFASSTDFDLEFAKMGMISPTDPHDGFLPNFRSGSYADIGPKKYMEDEHLCVDDLFDFLKSSPLNLPAPCSFYGVFDGHGGTDAACFVKSNLLKFIVEDNHFPSNLDKALRSAFMKADYFLADSDSLDRSSGTTVLTALIFGRTLLIANAGDCRAVLGKRGRAVELSKDHKPTCKTEKIRIEKLGGTIYDGYLNGQLSVSRALGDWHLKGAKNSLYPLSGDPELHEVPLTVEDEFLIIACDGLWDVMSSQCAVTMVRKALMVHNDPEECSKELVKEALNRNCCDNLTVLVVCFSTDPPPKIEVPRWRVRKSISMEGLHLVRGAMDGND